MILAEVHNVKESVLSAIAESVPDETSNESSSDRVINQVSNSDQVTFDMLSAIKELQKEIKELKSSKNKTRTLQRHPTKGNTRDTQPG
jgi:hypothetical protein